MLEMLNVLATGDDSAGVLFQKMPNLKLAEDVKDLQYTPVTQNVSITEMPVTW